MDCNEYQKKILSTRDCPENIVYYALGLTGEAGEVADKIKKYWRDAIYLRAKRFNNSNKMPESLQARLDETHMGGVQRHIDPDFKHNIAKELGDVLWYIAAIANSIDMNLDEVMQMNIDKIDKRVKTNTLHGEGDNREETK